MKFNQFFTRYLSISIVLLFSICLIAQPAADINPKAAGLSKTRLARLDAFLEKEIADKRIPGAVSLIYRKGAIAQYKTHGYSNLERKRSMTKDEIFYIQSMTKPIVSVGLMMLYEEGHFELNDPISKYFPAFKEMNVAKFVDVEGSGESKMELTPADKPITIAHCLSHTAGFSHGLGASEIDQMYLKALYYQPHKTIEERVMAMAKLPLVAQPDNVWYYSASPDVLALLIEHFSGQSCADFLQEKIFTPLGMNNTGYNVNSSNQRQIASLYQKTKQGTITLAKDQTKTQGNTVFGGTHALFSTASDYLKFCQMLLNNGSFKGKQVLGRKTIELMTADRVGDKWNAAGFGFGLGFGIKTNLAATAALASEGIYFWSGAYNTFFFIDPAEEMVALLMMQFAPYDDYYNRKFRQLVYQAIVD